MAHPRARSWWTREREFASRRSFPPPPLPLSKIFCKQPLALGGGPGGGSPRAGGLGVPRLCPKTPLRWLFLGQLRILPKKHVRILAKAVPTGEPLTMGFTTTLPIQDSIGCIYAGDALDAYCSWPAPATIVSDGAYGVGGFPGDPRTPAALGSWYRPHVEAWSKRAHHATTLWFWNTEIGWATVHPLLVEHGWSYVETIIWDKGVGHIAGNVNGDTLRQFPVTTEICVFYRRHLQFPTNEGSKVAKEWLRYEWQRAGLSLRQANEACGVRNAATRKYLTQDWLWYFPPPEMVERLVTFANDYGQPAGRPYFSIDGVKPVTAREWGTLRDTWTHQHGLTNVWTYPPLHGRERYRGNGKRSAPRVHSPGRQSAIHLNQKPLEFMRRIVTASTQPGDVVWEPFGGLCSAVVAAVELGRNAYAAEPVIEFYNLAVQRIAALNAATIESKHAECGERPSTSSSIGAGRQRDRRLPVAAAG